MPSKVVIAGGVAAVPFAEKLFATLRSADADALGIVAQASARPLSIARPLAALAGVQSAAAAGSVSAGSLRLAPPHDLITSVPTTYELATKYGYVGDPCVISWQHEGAVDDFEVELEHVENRIVQRFSSNVPQLTWTPDRAGHWRVRVRSRLIDDVSAWATSEESGWWFFFWLKPPGFP